MFKKLGFLFVMTVFLASCGGSGGGGGEEEPPFEGVIYNAAALIEENLVSTIENTITSADETISVKFGIGALPQDTMAGIYTITDELPVPSGLTAISLPFGLAVEAEGLSAPAEVTVYYDPGILPSGSTKNTVRLLTYTYKTDTAGSTAAELAAGWTLTRVVPDFNDNEFTVNVHNLQEFGVQLPPLAGKTDNPPLQVMRGRVFQIAAAEAPSSLTTQAGLISDLRLGLLNRLTGTEQTEMFNRIQENPVSILHDVSIGEEYYQGFARDPLTGIIDTMPVLHLNSGTGQTNMYILYGMYISHLLYEDTEWEIFVSQAPPGDTDLGDEVGRSKAFFMDIPFFLTALLTNNSFFDDYSRLIGEDPQDVDITEIAGVGALVFWDVVDGTQEAGGNIDPFNRFGALNEIFNVLRTEKPRTLSDWDDAFRNRILIEEPEEQFNLDLVYALNGIYFNVSGGVADYEGGIAENIDILSKKYIGGEEKAVVSSAKTNDLGTFILHNHPPGNYLVTAEADNTSTGQVAISISIGANTTLPISLAQTITLDINPVIENVMNELVVTLDFIDDVSISEIPENEQGISGTRYSIQQYYPAGQVGDTLVNDRNTIEVSLLDTESQAQAYYNSQMTSFLGTLTQVDFHGYNAMEGIYPFFEIDTIFWRAGRLVMIVTSQDNPTGTEESELLDKETVNEALYNALNAENILPAP